MEADDLLAHCRTTLAPYNLPAHIEFRRELPETLVGKVRDMVTAGPPLR
jgi:acyl-coenzyme A synthetase/AMP-(fatty) acid ligase